MHPAAPVQVTDSALKFQLPVSSTAMAAYDVSVDGSAPLPINLPDVWWWYVEASLHMCPTSEPQWSTCPNVNVRSTGTGCITI